MVSLALSLERIAGEADTAAVSPEQRAELAAAAARIRAVIEELAGREQRRLAAVGGGGGAVAVLGGAAAEEPEARARSWSSARIRVIVGSVLLALGLCLALFFVFEYTVTGAIQARSQQALLKQFGDRLALGPFNSPTAPRSPPGRWPCSRSRTSACTRSSSRAPPPPISSRRPGHVPGTPLPGRARKRGRDRAPVDLRQPVLQPGSAPPGRRHHRPDRAGTLQLHRVQGDTRAPRPAGRGRPDDQQPADARDLRLGVLQRPPGRDRQASGPAGGRATAAAGLRRPGSARHGRRLVGRIHRHPRGPGAGDRSSWPCGCTGAGRPRRRTW